MKRRGTGNYFSGKRFWMHFLFWFVHLLFFTVLGGTSDGKYLQHGLSQLVTLPIKMGQTYIVLYLLLPRYLLHKKYILFLVGLLISCLIAFFTLHVLNYYFIAPGIFNIPSAERFMSFNPSILWMAFISGYLMVLALVIKLTRVWHAQDKMAQRVLSDKLDAELKYLKAQIHPHFLFNTLNNLYTLAIKKSDKAPKVIEKLAGLLRYMTYEANQSKVSLSRDIENLQNYVLLEKIRYGSRLKTSLVISGETENKQIAPLILLTFVENSFKHGVSGEISDCWININIDVTGNQLTMALENSIATVKNDNLGYTEGIGLKNVKRRLSIIYKDKFELEISSTKSHLARLKIDLS